jgi:hypothetical protein
MLQLIPNQILFQLEISVIVICWQVRLKNLDLELMLQVYLLLESYT